MLYRLFTLALTSILFQCAYAGPVDITSTSPPIVDLGYAQYQGSFNSSNSITSFLGIRYAEPPIGMSFTSQII